MTSSQAYIDSIYNKIIQVVNSNPQKQKNIIIEIKGPRMTLKFNRPQRYNAFSVDMYITVANAINQAQNRSDIKFIVLTGQGGNFSSGNDLTNFTNPKIMQHGDFPDVIKAMSRVLSGITKAIINSKKPIIALTEGKVIGFTFTMLALLDKVFSVQSSTFIAPLVTSAQGPELCASYTFPKVFGRSVAQQLVIFGKQVKADYLQKFNFVQKCKSREEAQQKLNDYLNKIDQLEWYSYMNARRLFRDQDQKILLQVLQKQMQNLIQRWLNPNLFTFLAKHMQKMKKSPKL